MDAKLNQSDLISLLAKGSNISVAKAELFTKNFFDLIIEGLEKDGIVKINGLGTFKITDVASRGSVNVNTGEKIEIKGHKKLSFTPADALRDIVNQPFAMFEPVEVDDSYQPETSDIAENDDITDSVDAVETTENVQTDDTANVDATEEVVEVVEEPHLQVEENEEVVATESTVAEETVEETETAETIVEEPVSPDVEEPVTEEEPETEEVQVVVEEPATEEEPAVEEESNDNCAQEENATPDTPIENQATVAPKKKSKWGYAVFVILGFAVGFVGVKMMQRNHVDDDTTPAIITVETSESTSQTSPADAPVEVAPLVTDSVLNVENDTLAVQTPVVVEECATDTIIGVSQQIECEPVVNEVHEDDVYTFVMVDELAAADLKNITLADTLLYVADGELTRHKVTANETLTKIARTYYGDKKLWPYIVKFNKMRNPNGLGYGMEIGIPRLVPKK